MDGYRWSSFAVTFRSGSLIAAPEPTTLTLAASTLLMLATRRPRSRR